MEKRGDILTAKEYLEQAYALDRQVALLLLKVDKLRERIRGRGVSYDGVGVSGGTTDVLGDTITKIIEYEHTADTIIDKLVDKRLEIERTISMLPNSVQREILERRYLLYQPWETHFDKKTGDKVVGIDEAMNYSVRQVFRIHGEALKSMSVNVSEWQSKL